MEPAFLAVALVMVLLIGFVLIVVHSLAVSAGVRIRADMKRLLESYDRVIEVKSEEIRRLQQELENVPQSGAPAAPVGTPSVPAGGEEHRAASVPETAEYRHAAFGDSYGVVQNHFFLTEGEQQLLAEQVRQEERGTLRGAAAGALRQSLGYETVFRMAMLDSGEQLRLLDTSLNDEDWLLLRDYCEECPSGTEQFSITAFCDWLEEVSVLEGGGIELRSSGGAGQDGRRLICEGVQILAGGRLYDYSINEREIG